MGKKKPGFNIVKKPGSFVFANIPEKNWIAIFEKGFPGSLKYAKSNTTNAILYYFRTASNEKSATTLILKTSIKIKVIFDNWKTFKNDKKCFLFYLKSPFCS